uniref:NudC domain-containing protein 1 n=1 Tax=Anopheles epiroticus TaxID=199890 RepID=A0A182PX31_9DIPT
MPHIELRPDQKLLKPNFDGYKLSLESIPTHSMAFSSSNRPHRIDSQQEAKTKSLVHWHTLELQQAEKHIWTLCASRTLSSNGYPRYCVLDSYATAVLVASDQPFHFVYDSERPIAVPEQKLKQARKAGPLCWERFPFRWTQTVDEVNVTFDKEPYVHYRVINEPSSGTTEPSLKVYANDAIVIDETRLFARIDHDCTTWAMDRKLLDITMRKQQAGVLWPFIFPGGPVETVPEGDDSGSPTIADLPPAPNLNAPLEPCDFASGIDTYYTLERLSVVSHSVTHTILLGNEPPLFEVTLRAGLPATFAVRHDVDACLWQLQPVPYGADDCRVQHEGTLHAFGYIQASKRQQKYLGCAPSLSE